VFENLVGVNETSSFTWEILGYGENWTTYEATGVNGEINLGTPDYVFRDSVYNAFAGGDVGKWIIVVSSLKENCGIYKISTVIDSARVTIDYRANTVNGERYPLQQTGLTWYMLGDSYQVPSQLGTYWRLQSPSSKGWGLEVKYYKKVSQQGASCRVSVDNLWTLPKILETVYCGVANSKTVYHYLVTDTSGSYVGFLVHNHTDSLHNGWVVSEIAPYETGHSDTELVVLMGNKVNGTSVYDGNFTFDTSNLRMGHGYRYSERLRALIDCYVVDPTAFGYANSLRRYGTRQPNRRITGSQQITMTGDSIAMSGSTATLTDAAASFVASDVGRQVIIYNCTNPGNAGIFVITARLSATQIQYVNALGSNETSSFNWTMVQKIDVFGGTMLVSDKDNALNDYELLGKAVGIHTGQYNMAVNVAVNVNNYADYMHFKDGGMFEFIGFVGAHV
jgi:hypothetical protein